MRIFFATDIHGSEVCWRKFLNSAAFYQADLVILGGDVTGKVMIPITAHKGHWEVVWGGQTLRPETHEELAEIERQIRNRGSYDTLEIDGIFESSPCVSFAEGKLIELDGFHLVSMGWTNPTPWNTFREAPEEELAGKIEAVAAKVPDMERTIFNFHAPPYGTGLDEAPALDATLRPIHGGAVMKAVGSVAIREAILKHQPMLSIHGHIHESRGICRLGRTLAINPGSVYADGVLQGAVLDLNAKKGKVDKYLLVNG